MRVTLTDGGRASATSASFTINTNSDPSVVAFHSLYFVGDAMGVARRVTDDGRPNPPGAVTTTWSVISGPGGVTFDDASAVNTAATFSEVGDYVLRLTANDGALSAFSETVISVLPDTYPEARAACQTGPLPGAFDQQPQALFSDLWECRWGAPASDHPDSVAKADELARICRNTYDGLESTKLLNGSGAVFCNARPA